MASERVFYIKELEKLESELTALQIEFRAAKTNIRGSILEKFEDKVAEGRDHIKQLELAVERNNPDLKDWKEKMKAWNMAATGLKTMYVTEGQEDDGMFDSEANTVVKNQNDKLRGHGEDGTSRKRTRDESSISTLDQRPFTIQVCIKGLQI